MHKNYLAIDIGASSGRHIVGWMENGVLRTEEVYRFPNSVQRTDGHLVSFAVGRPHLYYNRGFSFLRHPLMIHR